MCRYPCPAHGFRLRLACIVRKTNPSSYCCPLLLPAVCCRSAQKVGLTVPQALDTVTALTGLRSLKLSGRGSLVDDAIVSSQQLLRMTVLQRLTRLEVPYHTFSKLPVSIWAGAYSWDKNLMFTNKVCCCWGSLVCQWHPGCTITVVL